jgi:hypothetical protein
MSLKSVEQKNTRTTEERQDKMEAMMEELMSKFDKMISRHEVPSHKVKKVEMPTIRAIMND